VILEATGRTLAELLVERVLQPLELRHTAPNVELLGDFLVTGFDRRAFYANMARPYELVDGQVISLSHVTGFDRRAFYANMARPYELVDGQVISLSHPRHFSASAGLLASVRDVAAISIALDEDRLLAPGTKDLMLSPSVWIDADEGKSYGLGWYVQTYEGVTLEWHGGEWDAQSALLLRAPEKKLTFVAAANTRRMSGAYYMGRGDVMESGVARLFVESFVLDDKPLP
jgi:CubicO group peptidase (beta-lactamase class C family)